MPAADTRPHVERLPPVVPVRSGRFTIRSYTVADAAVLGEAVIESLDHLRPWMPWTAEEPLPVEARRELIVRWHREREAGESAVYGMFAARPGGAEVVIGGCGLHRRREGRPDVVEIGYWVGVGHIRQGIATEAAGALTDAAFALAGTASVEILHLPHNFASRAVPARLGYESMGDQFLRGDTFSVWQVTRRAWSPLERLGGR